MNAFDIAELRRTLNQHGYDKWRIRFHKKPTRYAIYDETDTVQMVIRRAMHHPAWENGHAGHYGILLHYGTANQALVDGLDRMEAKQKRAERRARHLRNKFNRTRLAAIAGYAATATLAVAATICAAHELYIASYLTALGITIVATAAGMAHVIHHTTGQEMELRSITPKPAT